MHINQMTTKNDKNRSQPIKRANPTQFLVSVRITRAGSSSTGKTQRHSEHTCQTPDLSNTLAHT